MDDLTRDRLCTVNYNADYRYLSRLIFLCKKNVASKFIRPPDARHSMLVDSSSIYFLFSSATLPAR